MVFGALIGTHVFEFLFVYLYVEFLFISINLLFETLSFFFKFLLRTVYLFICIYFSLPYPYKN